MVRAVTYHPKQIVCLKSEKKVELKETRRNPFLNNNFLGKRKKKKNSLNILRRLERVGHKLFMRYKMMLKIYSTILFIEKIH